MPRETNFLLGQGERLTTPVKVPSGGGAKRSPYDFSTAKTRIADRLKVANVELKLLPDEACPGDQVVAVLTMHPRYISKSDFPEDLLKSVGLQSVGSRSRIITPDNWGIEKPPSAAITEEIFVAGRKEDFTRWETEVESWTERENSAITLTHIENLPTFKVEDKLRSIPIDRDEVMLEVVLHNRGGDTTIIDSFYAYVEFLEGKMLIERQRTVRGLTFVPVRAAISRVNDLAKFSFLRVARGMPQLRPFRPKLMRASLGFTVALPDVDVIDSATRAVIFDGGLPDKSGISRWVNLIEPSGIGKAVPEYQEHGLAVTSAFLFGPLSAGKAVPQPICLVDHVRVLDDKPDPDDLECVDVLDRILEHLDSNVGKYKYVNFSLGPDLAVDDDEVTVWTASLDERFAHGKFVATVAAGNAGHLDSLSGLNRVQPPADGVNVFAVGATDQQGNGWNRAEYSCVGPGRSPGIVKPDGVVFGGSDTELFGVLSASKPNHAEGMKGTSFAAPYALRSAVAIGSQLDTEIQPLAIRALMIQRANLATRDRKDVGWGLLETDHNLLVTCDDTEAIVIYQGDLLVGQHLRAPIPIPDGGLSGRVTIAATLVIAPEVDPEHPGAYTRAGLEVSFRPNSSRHAENEDGVRSMHPKTKSFFSASNITASEYILRDGGIKWEPCLQHSQNFQSRTLLEPVFDIYYHHRANAAAASKPQPIPYALVVSVKAPNVPDLYNRIVRTYAGILVPLLPKIRIPVRTKI